MKTNHLTFQSLDDFDFGSSIPVDVRVEKTTVEPDVYEYRVHLRWNADQARAENGECAVRFSLPCVGIQYMWHPDMRTRRALDADWRLNVSSMLTASAPMAMLFDGAGQNAFTFAADEVRKRLNVEFGVRDAGGSSTVSGLFHMELRQFGARDHTTLTLRADFRRVSCAAAVRAVGEWWQKTLPVSPLPVPEAARRPVYSSWYNFHKDIHADALLEECRLAKPLGMDTIIVDDGWQTDRNESGYGCTGDWEPFPGKFPDMADFVRQAHAIGMKVMLWYSVPFVGYFSRSFHRFESMLLRREDRNSTGILDPRHPAVREYLKETYVSAVRNYDLDGLKLDFIDRFQKPDFETQQPGMDFECVQEAVDFMMSDVVSALRALKPDLLIEFRQHYIGPRMRAFGNMFRVGDCPSDVTSNRVGIADLRMLSGNTAVHSDMITWNDADAVEDAALQVLNTLFGVTQVSKVLRDMNPRHKKMLAFWLDFERKNQAVLQLGSFEPHDPGSLYPAITATGADEEITCVYANDRVIELAPALRRHTLVNACWQPFLTLRVREAVRVSLKTCDCMGEAASQEVRALAPGLHEIAVPLSGLAVFEII